jgi:uncharacterized delta-60 repeat protein
MLDKMAMSKWGNKVKRIILVSTLFLIFTSFMSLNAQWARTYGGSDDDSPRSIQQTSDGGYIVAGSTNKPRSAGTGDFWILKLSSIGNIEWQKTYGGSDDDWSRSIQQTSDGGYIVAGHTKSFGAGYVDSWVLKLSSIGNIEWQKTYGGSDEDTAHSIQQTSDGGYIVAGHTKSFGAGYVDYWVLKLSSIGKIEWQKTYGTSNSDRAPSIQQTSDGGYIVAGNTTFPGAKYVDYWILKLSSVGNIEWQKTYGGSDDDSPRSIQQTSDGGYIVAGYAGSSYDSGGFYRKKPNIWLLKLYSDGEIEWQKTYGGSEKDSAWSIQQTSDGGYIVVGTTQSFGAGTDDFWILKLSSIGNIEWQKTYGGSDDDWSRSIQQTSDGGYIVVGTTKSFGAGEDDIWILKLSLNGDIPTCEIIGSSNASITDTSVSPVDTNITPDDTDVTPFDTNIFPQNTDATISLICGEAIDDDNGLCFIATAAYGSPLHPYVGTLRDFRDKYLMPTKLGGELVNLYYKYSPFVAYLIARHKALKIVVQINLLPFVALSYSMVHFGPIITTIILGFIYILPIFLVSFCRRKRSRVEAKDPKALASLD